MPKILALTYNDWANTGWRFTQCLRSLGLDVTYYKGRPHKFQYASEGPIYPALTDGMMLSQYPVAILCKELREEVERADILHFFASTMVVTGANLTGKKIVVNHGGSTFRIGTEAVKAAFNPYVDYSIIQCPDLLGLGAKNEVLIYYPVDTEALQPDYVPHEKIVIGHWPSSPHNKGTREIVEVIERLERDPSIKDRFVYVGQRVLGKQTIPWPDHLDRVRGCDVIIESMQPDIDGRRFGEWGNQAIEASALGKVVITNMLSEDTYREHYGECALRIANEPAQLESQLRSLFSMSADQLLMEKIQSRDWVVKNHSMNATAQRLWDKVYRHIV
jgi:hypothetical protein